MAPRVEVAQGTLEGKDCTTYYGKTYHSFEGIPYAKPPIGKLRFRNPEPPVNWTGVRDATKPGNKCCQLNPYSKGAIEGSEDCLYLNVYTPSLPAEKIQNLPVLFFVHGGRFIFGYGDYYRPDYLIKQDVILVTINYRLNILGFLCLDLPEAPGNAALKDTVQALRWVKQNIKKFNGNPENVTLFGESAGAGVVTACMTSKMADGLYHKVIAQSGNAAADLYMVEENPIQKATHAVSYLGRQITDNRELYEFLVDCPVEDLMIAFSSAEMGRHPGIINAYFLPVIEKSFDGIEKFCDQYPRVDFANNRFNKVPILMGQNSHEGALFIAKDRDGKVKFQKDLFYYIPRYMHVKQGSPRALDIEGRIREFYFGNKQIDENTLVEYINLYTDAIFLKEFIYLVDSLSKHSCLVYYYDFKYMGNLNLRTMKNLGMKGATHGDQIQYLFYKETKHSKCSESDLKMIEFMCEAWCNFAKNGEPTWTNQETKWRPYGLNDKHILSIGDKIELRQDVYPERMAFWRSLLEDKSKV